MSRIVSVITFVALAVSSTNATLAQTAIHPFYVGVSAGKSSVDGTAQAANPPSLSFGSALPTEVAANGLPFDDDASSWSVFAGYRATDHVGVELGYTDHGRFDGGFGGLKPFSIAMKEFSFGATLSYPFAKRFAVTAAAGVTRAKFDVDGAIGVLVTVPGGGFPTFPGLPASAIVIVPLATPEDRTGGYWKVGLEWHITDRIGTQVSYGKRALGVLEVENTALSLTYAF